jgi:hydrogenase maturation protease
VKPTLVLGLGNRLMGDDGIACHVADRLASDDAVLANADVISGATDVLRLADQFRDRRQVFVIDAALDDVGPGTVSVFDARDLEDSDQRRRHAHGISPIDTLGLLRAMEVLEPRTELKFVTISIGSARCDSGLSQALSRALPAITNRTRELITGES